ncbi:NACHT domain- and WD repeat-containing protein 1-like isoform x3 [Biomphalaria glabrata]|nr:hypothetical protein BgiMline_007078 [Biomphalaria glabrata]
MIPATAMHHNWQGSDRPKWALQPAGQSIRNTIPRPARTSLKAESNSQVNTQAAVSDSKELTKELTTIDEKKVKLLQLVHLSPELRFKRLIQLASHGKRNTVLPPLGNSQTSSQTLLSSDNPGDYLKVSVDVDKKIVTHLKQRKLIRRTPRRSDITSDKFKDEPENGHSNREQLKSGKSIDGRERLFKAYSETGEKIEPRSNYTRRKQNGAVLPKTTLNGHRTTLETIETPSLAEETNQSSPYTSRNGSESQNSASNQYDNDTQDNSSDQFSEDDLTDHVALTSNKKRHRHKALMTEVTSIESTAGETEGPALVSENEDSNFTDDSFHEVVVSPVQTPTATRPPTRENTKFVFEDSMASILAGQANKKCPPDQTVVNVYVASGPSDFEAERTFFQENLFPKLREFYLQRGQEIRILDLHWGFKDTIWDDHKIPKIIHKTIEKTRKSKFGLNFVALVGQKYGPKVLPEEIPKDDYEAIYAAALAYREEQLRLNSIKMSHIEAQRAQREKELPPVNEEDTPVPDESVPNGGVTYPDSSYERNASSEPSSSENPIQAADERRRKRSMAQRQEQQAIKILKESEEQLPDLDLLSQWYQLDTNAVPPVYRLQNISSVFKDISRNDSSKRAQAKAAFMTLANKFLAIFSTFGHKSLTNIWYFEHLTSSVFGRELEDIVDNEGTWDSTVFLVRTLDNLQKNLDDQAAQDYVDLATERPPKLDTVAWGKMKEFTETIHKNKVSAVSNFLLDWSPGGIKPDLRREHLVHVERMSKAVSDSVVRHLHELDTSFRKNRTWQGKLFQEVAEHVRCCQQKATNFHGRKELLTSIKTYLKSQSDSPLILYGKTGSGKSAIMAKTAKEIFKWFKSDEEPPRVLVRMIGCTVNSTSTRDMLRDVCYQLCYMFGQSPDEVPTDYKGILNDFGCRIGHSTSSRPLIIIIDGADRLTNENEGRKLQWLPVKLPPHVKLILSTVSDDKYECLPAARKILSGSVQNFLDVGQLTEPDALPLLRYWFESSGRTVTDEQFQVLVNAFRKCPYPLFLKVAFTDVLTWSSYMKPEWAKLGETVKKLATLRFGRLERDHGEPLVRRALGYITACRNGVTSNEMEDLLSLDDAVMDDVVAAFKPSVRRIPPLLWIKLLEDIEDLISECKADNLVTIRWAHSDINEAADERYLVQRDKAPSYHKAIAEYFQSIWAGTPKPFTGNEKGADRLVSNQALFSEPPDSKGYGDDRLYNLRKVNELPYHLLRAQLNVQLKQSCLCNFEWMLAKLCGTSLASLLEEYQPIIAAEPQEIELKLLYESLHLSAKALRCDCRQLASQIVGRLNNILTDDNPKSPGDVKKYPNLHSLVAAAKQSSLPALVPSISCLSEPGGVLCDQLSGHAEPITAFTMTTDGMQVLTASKDRTMKLWDIRTGRVIKSIEGIGCNVSTLKIAKDNSLAITVEGQVIKVWSIKSHSCLAIFDNFIDPPSIAVTADGQILASVFDGSALFRSWSLDSFLMLCEASFPDNSIHKDNAVLIADSSVGDKILHAFRSNSMATVQAARSGQIIGTLQCHDKSSAIVALAISRDYYIVCCRQQNVTMSEIHTLELFDIVKNTYIRSIRGCPLDNVRYLFVNLACSHAIGVSFNKANHTSDVVLFNLETEDHKHLAHHPSVSTMGACMDFRYCITGAEEECSLRIWDISSRINQPSPKAKKTHGVAEIWPMIDNPRYVVAKAINNGPISVWNVAKGKCLQSAVRIERGLAEGTDAMVIRNTKLVILTDKGYSPVTQDQRPVFQTVLVYDLKLKKYVRKLTGCYIVPAPSHEYVLLDNDCLLGPSESRSHFVIWNLLTGHAVTRIKTTFKDLERRKTDRSGLRTVTTPKPKRTSSATMTPWDRRAESRSARQRRHEAEAEMERQRLEELRKEKENAVDQFIISGDQKIIVASFYAHHLCVFDVEAKRHVQTLQTEYSMMLLHNAALTFDGGHLVHANYDEDSKLSYVTLWDCRLGEVKRRLRNESNVAALAITDDAQRIIIGRAPNRLHVWDPMKPSSLRRIRGYDGLRFEINSKIFIVENGRKAIVFAVDISVWDLEAGAALAIFTPDTKITVCDVVLGGQIIVFGMYDRPNLVILRLMSNKMAQVEDTGGLELFGETTGDTTDEDEEEEEKEKKENSGKDSK